jgi:hypothetical protein
MTGLNLRKVAKLFGLFLLFYAVTLPLWLGVKTVYQQIVTVPMFKAAGWVYDIRLVEAHTEGDNIIMTATNRYPSIGLDGNDRSVVFDTALDIDAITFNLPMTLALLLSIVLVYAGSRKQKQDQIFNGMFLLVGLHFLTMFVISLSLIVSTALGNDDLMFYLKHAWMPQELLVNLGSLLSSYAARFEPFLIALFVWWRMQSGTEKEEGEDKGPLRQEMTYPEM